MGLVVLATLPREASSVSDCQSTQPLLIARSLLESESSLVLVLPYPWQNGTWLREVAVVYRGLYLQWQVMCCHWQGDVGPHRLVFPEPCFHGRLFLRAPILPAWHVQGAWAWDRTGGGCRAGAVAAGLSSYRGST